MHSSAGLSLFEGSALALSFSCVVFVDGCGSMMGSSPSDPAPATNGAPTSAVAVATNDAGLLTPLSGELNGGCAPDGTSGHQTKTCADGVAFDIDIPDRCTSSACGVILDVHGWSMNGPMQALHTRLSDLARDMAFMVIHPTAPGKTPSWGKGASPFDTDFAYDPTVWGFVQATIARFHADEKRVHVTGFSQGAMMAFRLAFAHSEQIASIAPISGPSGFVTPSPVSGSTPTGNVPSRKLPILYIHGTKDQELKFDANAVVLRDQIVKAYALGDPDTIHSEATLRAYSYKKDGAVLFEFWEHDYMTTNQNTVGGHCVAGPVENGDGVLYGKPPSPKPFRCVDPNQAFDAGTEILRFFEEHAMP